MKNITSSLRCILAGLCLSLCLFANNAVAGLLYWDNNGLAAPTSGIWDTLSFQWATNSVLTNAPVLWDPVNAAAFPAGTAGVSNLTITLTNSIDTAGIFNGLVSTVGVTNLTFTGSGALNLPSGVAEGFWTGNANFNTIIRVPITGTGGVENESSGSLYLATNNTYSGGTVLGTSAGLNFNNGNAFGTGPISCLVATVVLATPAVAPSTGVTTPFATPGPINVTNSMITYDGNGSAILVGLTNVPVTFSGPWTMSSIPFTTTILDVRVQTWTISGAISGAANLSKKNTAILVLSGANTYTGSTLIQNGSVMVSSLNSVSGGTASSSLGAPTDPNFGMIILGATTTAGTLLYTGPGETTDRPIFLGGSTGGGIIQNDGTGALIFTSDFAAPTNGIKTLTLQGTNTNNNTIMGAIVDSAAGATAVTKSGTGTWTLAGVNTYSGVTTLGTGGRLNLANALALGANTFVVSGNGFFDNTTGSDLTEANAFTLSGGSPTYVGSANNMTINGTVTLSGANRTITVSAHTLTLGSAIVQDVAGRAFTKAGAGTLSLLGANTYTGNTTISAGTLALGSSSSLATTNTITISAGGTLDVSAIPTFTLSASNLTATGSNTVAGVSAAVIKGGTTINLGTHPISLTFKPTSFTGDTGHPSLVISQGILSLSGNVFTVNNASGTALGAGTYQIIQQLTDSITSSGSSTVTVTGSGLTAGSTASIQISGGNVNLVVVTAASPATISTPTILGNGTVQLNFSGTAGASYIIQGATNLNSPILWVPLSTNTADGGGLFNFTDTAATNYAQRYYRVQNN